MRRGKTLVVPFVLALAVALTPPAALAEVSSAVLGGMKWRQIGPFRGGRVLAVSGVPGDAATWYFGGVAGGVWKSTDAAASWRPVFDDQKIASIGAIAVADSDHNVVYVGSGEACPRGNITYGDGVYKSLDAGRTWKNIGLRDTRHIGAVAVHPKNPDIVLVAALGHVYGSNEERGVFRSADGGKSSEGAVSRRRDRRDRCNFRSRECKRCLRLAVADAAPAVVLLKRWTGLGSVQVDRRRLDVETTRRPRIAGWHARSDRRIGGRRQY